MARRKPTGKPPKPALSPRPAQTKIAVHPIWWVILGLVALTTFAYWGSTGNGFTNWDDPIYVTEQALIQSINLPAIFSTYISGNYHPLTMLSLAIDYALHGSGPYGFHLTNLLLHLLNTLLVAFLIWRLSGSWQVAAFVGGVFGLHPMHVESVAWISERKDLLYTLFYLLGMLAWWRYIKRQDNRPLWYVATLLVFMAALLSKAVAVTFPLALLLMDWHHRRGWGRGVWLEKAPMLALSAVFGYVAIIAQADAQAITTTEVYTTFERLFLAAYGFLMYIVKFFVPFNLSNFYPYPAKVGSTIPAIYFAALPVAIGLLYGAWKWSRHNQLAGFGAGFMVLTLALVSQVIPVGAAVMADRYTYMPYIGLALVVAMGAAYLLKKRPALKPLLWGTTLAYVITMAVLTYQRVPVWENSESLWTDCLAKNPNVPVAWNNRGNFYARELQDYDRALEDYNMALRVDSTFYRAYINRGNIFGIRGEHGLSMMEYNRALHYKPGDPEALVNRSISKSNMQMYEEALSDLDEALGIHPGFIQAIRARAFILSDMGRFEEALPAIEQFLEVNASDVDARFRYAYVLIKLNRVDESLREYNTVIAMQPTKGEAYQNRSVIYRDRGMYREALQDALRAQELGQRVPQSYINYLQGKVQ
jgi:protein O-mannosyl-transferase